MQYFQDFLRTWIYIFCNIFYIFPIWRYIFCNIFYIFPICRYTKCSPVKVNVSDQKGYCLSKFIGCYLLPNFAKRWYFTSLCLTLRWYFTSLCLPQRWYFTSLFLSQRWYFTSLFLPQTEVVFSQPFCRTTSGQCS